ncbi:MAG: Leucine-rich repeat domain protein [Promethearchaeota archaeon]|nr:MAG: Leucine-rich repeat domain protein [Candidatus Lokiarchaeota archaeon]
MIHIFILLFVIAILLSLVLTISNPKPKNEYKVNEYLKLKLENGVTNIYVKERRFRQCMYLLLNIPTENIRDFDEIDSIDEAAEFLDRSMEGSRVGKHNITPDVEFWGHCSNLQAWVENGYDTRILHRNLAFPLLKRLVEVGDPNAKKVFKEEIALRIASGHSTVISFLTEEGYLKYLNSEEFETLFEEIQLPIIQRFSSRLKNLLENSIEVSEARIIGLLKRLFRNFNILHVPILFHRLKKEIPPKYIEKIVRILDDEYKAKKEFPRIQFINKNIEFFDEDEFDFIKYNERIIGLKQGNVVSINNQNIVDIQKIKGLENDLENLIELDLSYNQINSLSGIEAYSNLKVLKLNNNKIEVIRPLKTLKHLEELSLRNNKISFIKDISDLVQLKKLDLSGNLNLTKIPETLNKIPSLKSVKLWNCDIKSVTPSTLRFLWKNQNYRYYTGFSEDSIRYYENTHKCKALSHVDNKVYKAFAKWDIRMKRIMKEFNFTYSELFKFEDEQNSNPIWSGKPTNSFKKWLDDRYQLKITDFF